MIEYDTYYAALSSFLRAVRNHSEPLPLQEITPSPLSLHLYADGTWEVTKTDTNARDLPQKRAQSICVPLVFPLVPVILIAHFQTQWARLEAEQQKQLQHSRETSFAFA